MQRSSGYGASPAPSHGRDRDRAESRNASYRGRGGSEPRGRSFHVLPTVDT